jgi:hypothetical protein
MAYEVLACGVVLFVIGCLSYEVWNWSFNDRSLIVKACRDFRIGERVYALLLHFKSWEDSRRRAQSELMRKNLSSVEEAKQRREKTRQSEEQNQRSQRLSMDASLKYARRRYQSDLAFRYEVNIAIARMKKEDEDGGSQGGVIHRLVAHDVRIQWALLEVAERHGINVSYW